LREQGAWSSTAVVRLPLASLRPLACLAADRARPRAAIFGPAATQWYKVLTKINLGNKYATTAARVLTDQTVFASCNLGFFLSSMAYMEGASPKARLQSTYVEALKKNWLVWPAVQTLNFTYVPLHHRVLVVNIVSLGWNCYLSYVNGKGGDSKLSPEEKVGSVV
jgi:protein Mpv17